MGKPKPGRIVIVSSPSGGGKTTICRKLLSPTRRRQGWAFSVSYTTREPRKGEQDGREYHFVSNGQFDRLIREGFFAEHFKVHLYKYGTPRGPLEQVLRRGGVMLLDIDVKGAQRIRAEFPEAVSIFVLPPSRAALQRRLRKRGTETTAQLKLRLENAIREMRTFQRYRFEYVVVNEDLKTAVNQVLSIVEAHGCRLDKRDPEQLRKITG
jgi:guanylate kinase